MIIINITIYHLCIIWVAKQGLCINVSELNHSSHCQYACFSLNHPHRNHYWQPTVSTVCHENTFCFVSSNSKVTRWHSSVISELVSVVPWCSMTQWKVAQSPRCGGCEVWEEKKRQAAPLWHWDVPQATGVQLVPSSRQSLPAIIPNYACASINNMNQTISLLIFIVRIIIYGNPITNHHPYH